MALIDNPQKLKAEDFTEEHRETVEKISTIYNYFVEQVTNTINGNLDKDNTTSDLVEIDLIVDANGIPTYGSKFSAKSGMKGSKVVSCKSVGSITYPSSAPFITFETVSSTLYNIKHCTGIQANVKFKVLLELMPN